MLIYQVIIIDIETNRIYPCFEQDFECDSLEEKRLEFIKKYSELNIDVMVNFVYKNKDNLTKMTDFKKNEQK